MANPIITVSGGSVQESPNSSPKIQFIVDLSEPATSVVDVYYRTLQGAGTGLDEGVDYFHKQSFVRFQIGESSKTIEIEVQDQDALDETDESVMIELFNAINAMFPDGATTLRTTGFILDDDGDTSDGGSRALFVSQVQVVEVDDGSRQAQFEVLLSRSSGSAITLNYETRDGSAVAGSDYISQDSSLTFNPGETSKTVIVPLIGDTVAEDNEFFNLVLTPTAAIANGSDGAVGTAVIIDDDSNGALPEISISGGTMVESPNSSPELQFVVTLSEPATSVVDIYYRTLQGAGTALDEGVDFFQKESFVRLQVGQTSATINISVQDLDALDEVDESVMVELFDASNAVFPDGATTLRATGFILDDDGNTNDDASRALFVSQEQVVETDGGGQQAVFEAQLSRASDSTITLDYTTADGSAIAGEDYSARSGSLTFAPGETRKSVLVPLLGDTVIESNEYFNLVFTPTGDIASGAAGAAGTAVILDDDSDGARPEISIAGGTMVESPNSSPELQFMVTLSEPATSIIDVSYRTLQGAGTALDEGVDYFQAESFLRFQVGDTSSTIRISVQDQDALDEADESVIVELFDPGAGVFPNGATTLRATGFILDDDGDTTDDGSRALYVSQVQLVEGNGGTRVAEFEVSLSRPSASAIALDYMTVDGTAMAGEDYAAQDGSLTFAPGEMRKSVLVPLLGDTAPEDNEFFNLVFTPTGAIANGGAGAAGMAIILDDDSDGALPELSISGGRMVESPNSSPELQFEVTLSQPATSIVDVNYRTVQGAGTALDQGVDYFGKESFVRFQVGDTSATIKIAVQDVDALDEPDESVVVELFNPVNAVFPDGAGNLQATGFILDDDGNTSDAASRTLFVSDARVVEGDSGATFASFVAEISRAPDSDLILNYQTLNGSATGGIDFTSLDQSLTFHAGQTRAAVLVPIIPDTDVEGDETFSLAFDATASLANGQAPITAIGTIVDDDSDDPNNNPPTGGVQILGQGTAGQLLGADTSTLADADGLGPLSYQWLRNNEVIPTATANTYLMGVSDVGSAISVQVSYIDGAGNAESVSSDLLTDIGIVVEGNSLDNALVGSEGNDILRGFDGNDSLTGGDGDDLLDGGPGNDTVILRHLPSQYDFVSDLLSGPEGNDRLVSIESIGLGYHLGNPVFEVLVKATDLIDPDGPGPEKSVAAYLLDQITDLYVAYFDRAPDAPGLAYWFKEIYDGTLSLFDTARSFTDQPEYAATYPPGSSNRDFIETIYENLFDRLPDGPGWDYWENQLDEGLPRDTFILTVISGAYAPTGGLLDRILLVNKHNVSMYYAEQSSLYPEEGFDESITDVLNRISTDENSVDSAKDVIDYAMENPITLSGIVEDSVLWESFW